LPESGEVLYEGVSTAELNRNQYRRKDASVVYQSFNLFPLLNALENVMVPMGLNHVSGKEAKTRARQLLQSVGLPQTIERQFPKMMSGGEQQRVAIARALASEAPLILADEPTGNLDTENSDHIVNILQSLAHEQKRCVIVITHDSAVAERTDILLRLVDGNWLDPAYTMSSCQKYPCFCKKSTGGVLWDVRLCFLDSRYLLFYIKYRKK